MHHVKRLKDGEENGNVARLMNMLNRKVIPVCKRCHVDIHKGVYDGVDLKFMKATEQD